MIKITVGFAFDLYSGDCFDRVIENSEKTLETPVGVK